MSWHAQARPIALRLRISHWHRPKRLSSKCPAVPCEASEQNTFKSVALPVKCALKRRKERYRVTSTVSGQPAAASRSLGEVMRQRPLFFFFLMAYAFSWIMVIPFILEEWGYPPEAFSCTFILVPFGGRSWRPLS